MGTPILGVVWQSRSRYQARILLIGFGRPPSPKPHLRRYRHPGVVHRPRKSLVRHSVTYEETCSLVTVMRRLVPSRVTGRHYSRSALRSPRPLVGSGPPVHLLAVGCSWSPVRWSAVVCPVKRNISSECTTTVTLGCSASASSRGLYFVTAPSKKFWPFDFPDGGSPAVNSRRCPTSLVRVMGHSLRRNRIIPRSVRVYFDKAFELILSPSASGRSVARNGTSYGF